MKTIDFRSDTMTTPTDAMRDAMRDAVVGDDVCDEDPTVGRLQELAAELTGKEAALFVPSGTFGNQCAIGVHTKPGDEMIVAESAHIVEHEVGAAAALAGVHVRCVSPASQSYLEASDILPRLRTIDDVHLPDTGLIALENSLSDGTVMPLQAMAEVAALARAHNIPVHLDGARLFNAAIALGVSAAQLTAHVDTASFCLSKGLGAPVGSLLVGSRAFVDNAKRRRKMMGGGMRQVGVLAAPGLLAMTAGIKRLPEDHQNARRLAEGMMSIDGLIVDPRKVQTNMVFCHVDPRTEKTDEQLITFLASKQILTYPPLPQGIRFVTYSGVDSTDVDRLLDALAQFFIGNR